MANRCLNKVMLIGNLTRDPELRYTPSGVAVCSFGLATNRSWTTQSGEQRDDAQFHQIVAWNKLAELCSQLLAKGRRVYVEGRLQHREWTGKDGGKRKDAEVIISDMIILDSRQAAADTSLEEELEKAAGFGDESGETAQEEQASLKPKKEKPKEEEQPF
ncbi:MAG: single-stranded DNA-binding protein [Candidatus Shapirobacteria bacterium]